MIIRTTCCRISSDNRDYCAIPLKHQTKRRKRGEQNGIIKI